MNTRLATSIFVLGTLLAPLATYATDKDSDRSHPEAYAKDSVITTKIKTRLAGEEMSSLAKISVDTDNRGAVVLSGHTRTQREADKAVSIARATEGVTSVESRITIKKDD